MKKIIFVAFSDLHINDWGDFSPNHQRLENIAIVFKAISNEAVRYKAPVLFTGDWCHNPKYWDNYSLQYSMGCFDHYFEKTRVPVYAISGNHDLCWNNSKEKLSPSQLFPFERAFNQFHNWDFRTGVVNDNYLIGIPWMDDVDKWAIEVNHHANQASGKIFPKILLLHSDMPGASDPSGWMNEDLPSAIKWVEKDLKKFKLVLCGHIHKPQKLFPNTYMLGAPMHQRKSDAGVSMGYWLIYEDYTMKFVDLKLPEYRYYDGGKFPDDYNFWLERGKEESREEESESENTFHNNDKPIKLASKYLKSKGITDPEKIQTLKTIIRQ